MERNNDANILINAEEGNVTSIKIERPVKTIKSSKFWRIAYMLLLLQLAIVFVCLCLFTFNFWQSMNYGPRLLDVDEIEIYNTDDDKINNRLFNTHIIDDTTDFSGDSDINPELLDDKDDEEITFGESKYCRAAIELLARMAAWQNFSLLQSELTLLNHPEQNEEENPLIEDNSTNEENNDVNDEKLMKSLVAELNDIPWETFIQSVEDTSGELINRGSLNSPGFVSSKINLNGFVKAKVEEDHSFEQVEERKEENSPTKDSSTEELVNIYLPTISNSESDSGPILKRYVVLVSILYPYLDKPYESNCFECTNYGMKLFDDPDIRNFKANLRNVLSLEEIKEKLQHELFD